VDDMEQERKNILIEFFEENGILYESGKLTGYSSDASFLTLGTPEIIVFPKDEEEVVKIVDLAIKEKVNLVPRGTASGTAGSSLSPTEALLVDMQRVGACNEWGNRIGIMIPQVVDRNGDAVDLAKASKEKDLYIRVGAGVTSDEVTPYLSKYGWAVAVVPSSGYSTFGGNFGTNARGSGTPKFGAFADIVNSLRMVVSSPHGAKVVTITDREEIRKLGGNHGLFGLVTELDVKIAPIPSVEKMICIILSAEMEDVEKLGEIMGSIMSEVVQKCKYFAGEFMFIDRRIVREEDPIRIDPTLGGYFAVKEGTKKMLLMYRGDRDEMKELKSISQGFEEVDYKEVSYKDFQRMMDVRKAATGRAAGRIAVPGFEDFIILDPGLFGKVIAKMFEIMETSGIPGRAIGHHYPDGVTVHYRPQAEISRQGLANAWELTQKLREEILKPEYKTENRREHGIGLELLSSVSEDKRREILHLKRKYDPIGIFNAHMVSGGVQSEFAGLKFQSLE